MKKRKIVRIRNIEHLRYQKIRLEEEAQNLEYRIDARQKQIGQTLNPGTIINEVFGVPDSHSDIINHLLPLAVKYREFIATGIKKSNKKWLFLAASGAGVGYLGINLYKKIKKRHQQTQEQDDDQDETDE